MPVDWKLVVDCAQPLPLARFWAEALDYTLEDHHDLIERLHAGGMVGADAFTEVDGRKVWNHAAAVRHPDDPVDPATGSGMGRRVLFLRVPEPKTAKNRLHVDLHYGPERRDAAVKHLEGLGATVIRVVQEPGSFHVTMADPEGNEFDVQ